MTVITDILTEECHGYTYVIVRITLILRSSHHMYQARNKRMPAFLDLGSYVILLLLACALSSSRLLCITFASYLIHLQMSALALLFLIVIDLDHCKLTFAYIRVVLDAFNFF